MIKNLKKYLDKYIFWICLIISFPAVWALFVPGFYGASDELHVAWLNQMYETLKIGQIPPRFVPDLSFNHGYPLFNFVFPLPFYIGSIFHFLGLNLVDSVKAVFFISIPLSAFFMFKLLRQYVGVWLSFLGALIYVYAPYRATEIYVRGAIGEILSFTFLPLILLSLNHLSQKVKSKKMLLKWVGIAGISIAFLILTHNIVSYMFFPFLLLFICFQIYTSSSKIQRLKDYLISITLAMLLSGYFWIPALIDSSLMKYSTVFNFWDHFPTIHQLITPYFGYGASVPGPGDTMSFFIGLANMALICISIFVLIFKHKTIKKKDKVLIIWSIITIFISFFMMNHRSFFIWRSIPFLPYFQFPWRFLTLVTFASSVLVVSLKYLANKKTYSIAILFLVLLTLQCFKPQDFLGRTDDYFLARYIPYPELKEEYLTQNEEYLRPPKTQTENPKDITALYFDDKNGIVDINILNEGRLALQSDVYTSSDVTVKYSKYFFPGWTVIDNGNEIDAYASEPYGDVTFMLTGKGNHHINISYKETPFRLVLDIISLLAFTFCLYLVFRIKRYKFEK